MKNVFVVNVRNRMIKQTTNCRFKLFCSLLLLILVNSLFAQLPPLTLQEVVKEAKENNPEIKALREKYLATKTRIIQTKTWEYPQAGVGLSRISDSEGMFSFTQMIPYPGKLSLRGEIAEKETSIAEENLRAKELEIMAKVKHSYWMLFFVNKTIEIYRNNIELMKQYTKIAETEYTAGKVTQIDPLKANTEIAKMLNLLVILEQEKGSAEAMLNALLNRPPDKELGAPEEPKERKLNYAYKDLEKLALEKRPELKKQEFFLSRNRSALTLSRLEWYPDIMSGFKVGTMGSWEGMLSANIPLYTRKQRAMIEEMSKEKEMAEFELQAMKIMTLSEIRDLWLKYDTRNRSAEIYRTNIIPLAEQTLRISEASYRAGRNSFLELLDSQRVFLENQLEYYRALTDREHYFTELEQVVGIDLK